MALNGDQLGIELEAAAQAYNDVPVDTTNPVAMANYRKGYWKALGNAIVNHIKINGKPVVPGLGLAAPNGPVTGSSSTGTIQ